MNYFKNVIGYEHIKNELERVIDCLNNQEKYEALGAKRPNGILLRGEPGVGKTTMAKSILEALNRNKYIIRKDRPNGEFVSYLSDTINEAIKNAPSAILLDDIDKYANNDDSHVNAEEFTVIQTGVDNAKDKDVFFIVTANDTSCIPPSLLRAGRIDYEIEMEAPELDDAKEIIAYYLRDKNISSDIDIEEITKLLAGTTCSTLELVLNEASLIAGFKSHKQIEDDDVITAILRVVFDSPKSTKDKNSFQTEIAAVHEAGHALVSEVLEPGSVNLVCIENYYGSTGGITATTKADDYWWDISLMENRIVTLLAGKAATEIVLNRLDCGSKVDVSRADSILDRFDMGYYIHGFDASGIGYSSDDLTKQRNIRRVVTINNYYEKSKKIIFDNMDKLNKMIAELKKKKMLRKKDISLIMNN